MSARAVVGVPVMPPGWLAVGVDRVRSTLGRLHARLAPPPVQILEGVFGMLDHRVLVAVCEAGVPEALDRPLAVDELARRVGADPAMLERLVRFAATRGWLAIDRRGRVRPTRVTRFLRRDHPGGWRAWVDFAGGREVVEAAAALSASPGADPFTTTHGAPFFTWMADHPAQWAVFDEAMAAGARLHALGLASALDWDDTRRICDVGGGAGALLATLLDLVPHAEGAVLDLHDVVARADAHPRLTALAGDAFAAVPPGFDTYLLVNVLHDWDDGDATTILRRVAEVVGDGRLVVVEGERTPRPRAGVTVSADVLMAALTSGGRERDTVAFRRLGLEAGLHLARSVRLASGDLAHVFVGLPAEGG